MTGATVAAVGVGVATLSEPTGKVLDTRYAIVSRDDLDGLDALTAACYHTAGSRTCELPRQAPAGVAETLGRDHPVAAAVRSAVDAASGNGPPTRTRRMPVATFVADLQAPPEDAHDAYLRLHLLSHRLVQPHGISLDGVFRVLENVVWTDLGPCDPDGFEELRSQLAARGLHVRVSSVDKFPRMTDYVVPSGVRIADADRVRLGAHLAPGTTVMHEGFVNFNAGTLGRAMVEGRISSGVVVGDNSDVGGGASIMGTLSGGGTQVVSVGAGCLIGANAGIGISLGDGCVVEAGLYVTAGSRVALPDGRVVKARELSGQPGWLFRRHSQTGAIEALPREREWGDLNLDLHANA